MPRLMLLVHFLECDENAAEVECESPQTEPDGVLELQRKIELLETQLTARKSSVKKRRNIGVIGTSIFHQQN